MRRKLKTMKTNSLKLFVVAAGVTLLTQSCLGPTYVESSPPPPPTVYTQAPPPPPPAAYTEPAPVQQPAPTYVQQQQPAPTYVQQQQPEPVTVSYQTFYNELSPYGQWISTPEYGYVWIPSAGTNFQPYGTNGHWVLTDIGWTWVSDYNWGWCAFHYGRWAFDGAFGWYWIPGYEWAPAWVNWRRCDGYYGWCPLGPNYVEGGYESYSCPPERYVFVRSAYITNVNVYNYYEPRTTYTTYYNRSTVVSNTYYDNSTHNTYYGGPQRAEVEKSGGVQVRPVALVQSNTPERGGVNGNQVSIYRPAVQQPTKDEVQRPAPPKVFQKTEVTPVTQRTVLTQPNQPRVEPFKPVVVQKPAQQQPPAQQQQQQRPPVQQQQPPAQQQQQQRPPVMQQQPPAQQQQQQRPPVMQQQPPAQQQQQQRPPVMQQQPPAQQQQQQRPPVQQQQAPVQQQQPAQQQRPAVQQQPAQQQRPAVQQQQRPAQQQKPTQRQQQTPKQTRQLPKEQKQQPSKDNKEKKQ